MKTYKDLKLEEGLNKEWIITNGIGGYASSTIIGANTRKYHGLLVAPLLPPGRRHLILSKLDESVDIAGTNYPLYTNLCKNYISEGYKSQQIFEKEYIPEFTYKVKDMVIKKQVCMQYGKNTVVIVYTIKNGKENAILKLAPIVNFRDFHTMSTNYQFSLNQEIKDKKVKLVVNQKIENPIYMHITEGKYTEHVNDSFNNMYYIEEEKRGFFPEENHAVTGVYEIEINAKETKEITFICSLEENIEEIDGTKVIKSEIKRIDNIIKESKLIKYRRKADKVTKQELDQEEFVKDLIKATDNFIVTRPSLGLHTIIAGYHWFLDWGRDSFISFEGLLLLTKRFEIAKEVLLTFTRDMKYGLVPNGYSGFDSRPLYNSVDSGLLLFEQVNKFLKYTNDYSFVRENLYDTLKNIINCYKEGITFDDNNIYLDKDGLISAGTEKTQTTWMDAKIGNLVVTPRHGKAVEINAMWYNALKILEDLSARFGEESLAKTYESLAKKSKTAFAKNFYNKEKSCLHDVIGDDKVRPNQIFALSLSYPVISLDNKLALEVFNTVTDKLLNKYGLQTLAKKEKDYIGIYEGDNFKRDMSYHQGVTWPWLLGQYNAAFLNIINATKAKTKKEELEKQYSKFKETVDKTFKKVLWEEGAVGSISEIYDSKAPYLPKGTVAQAWSVAEILRIIV